MGVYLGNIDGSARNIVGCEVDCTQLTVLYDQKTISIFRGQNKSEMEGGKINASCIRSRFRDRYSFGRYVFADDYDNKPGRMHYCNGDDP